MTEHDADHEILSALDWRGAPVECASCPHLALRDTGACEPLRSCVHDRYARRVERFFKHNPQLANDYLTHPYFEVRALAARHADAFRLPPLLGDVDEVVRWAAVSRLPYRFLLELRDDPHREVRIRVAGRLEDNDLLPMLGDSDYQVRLTIARRIRPELLSLMMRDADAHVRRTAAARIPVASLLEMLGDPEGEVRLEAARRLPSALLHRLSNDPDWRVRYEVAARTEDSRVLLELSYNDDEAVARLARERLFGVQASNDPVLH